jgi:cytochrome c oxidase assembly protein subunit 15
LKLTAIKSFQKLSLVTLVAVYFLILVGGIVRTTGSGMGCPDWPKCFGSWVPPTSVTQLPSTYKEDFTAIRIKKNTKFASLLFKLGFESKANELLADKSVLAEEDFNATRTWIEYLNRLVGVVVGFLIVFLFWRSLKLRKDHSSIFYLSFATLIGVIFQGWFGSIVVVTNLTTWTITVHMFLALLIIVFLILLYWRSRETDTIVFNPSNQESNQLLKPILLICITAILLQTLFGTQVRASIDRVASTVLPRAEWIQNLGEEFLLHRSFSWFVLLVHVLLIYLLRKTKRENALSTALIVLILCGIISGVVMAYFSIPAYIQPFHLLLATVIFGIQILLLLKLNTSSPKVLN